MLFRSTVIYVVSSTSDDLNASPRSFRQGIVHDLDDMLTFEQAEAYVASLPEFEAYVSPVETLIESIKDELTDEQASTIVEYYPVWASGEQYLAGDRVRYLDGFYKCLQQHMSQEGWTPVDAQSLWTAIIDASAPDSDPYPEWVQPESTNPYQIGDRVSHNGLHWVSTVDGNVWEPGIYGWDLIEQDENNMKTAS